MIIDTLVSSAGLILGITRLSVEPENVLPKRGIARTFIDYQCVMIKILVPSDLSCVESTAPRRFIIVAEIQVSVVY